MKPFLKLVAEDLYKKFDGRLDNVAVVFPNKRAGLFFNEYLLDCSGEMPIWSPRYMTISELFEQNSELSIGDSILLVSKLYKEYVRPKRDGESDEEYENSVESLDSFYYWGEMLLRDFDDIDKNLADTKRLFSNIADLYSMGNGKDTLEPEQIEAIQRFFKNFNPDQKSDIKENFTSIWNRLFDIYTRFKASLRRINVAYEGMLYRDIIENGEALQLKHDKYVFVGFNALNGAERKLFDMIRKSGKALFYWDYDTYYVKEQFHEAGHFMHMNLERFSNELSIDCFRQLETSKSVTVASAGTESIEARYVSEWLNGNLTENNVETAIVLCDETMLDPVLHTIPEKANGHDLNSLNVTMGYPIPSTPIYSLVKSLVELHTRGWSEKHQAFMLVNVCRLLKHPYVIQGSPEANGLMKDLVKNNIFYPTDEVLHKDGFLKKIFTHCNSNIEWIENLAEIIYTVAENRKRVADEKHQMYDLLFNEAIMKVYTQAQRLKALHSAGELNMKLATVGKLFIRVLGSMTMPFHGEPVAGLQVMGLLETRNLDFKNIIMLGVNEGAVPKNSGENSFIPYNLRRAFGLTLSEHRDSIYAYYFFRLLQRAENVTLVYNSSPSGKYRGECSRYILQLLGSNLYNIKKLGLTAKQENREFASGNVTKTEEMIKRLRERFDYSFSNDAMPMSPSAINLYNNCGLSFFFYHVLGLKPIEEINSELKPTDFGTIFHSAAEMLYDELTKNGNSVITKNMLEYYIESPALLERFVDKAFAKEFFKDGKLEYNGEQYINRGVLHNFLYRLVKMDAEYAPFTYIGGEKKIMISRPVKCNGFDVNLNLGGTIDRIDIKDDTVNIVDYKTGSADTATKIDLDTIFGNSIKSAGNRLQALLYSCALDDILNGESPLPKEDTFDWIKEVQENGATKVSPSLLYMRKNKKKEDGNSPVDIDRKTGVIEIAGTPVSDVAVLKADYLDRLDGIIKEIFNIDVEFAAAEDEKKCTYCKYKAICRKE